MGKLKIFLSHVTVESRLADLLQTHLTHDFLGLVEVFVSSDRTSITAGEEWLPKIIHELDQSSLMLVLCSPDSVERKWINFEIGAARFRGIPILPFCHSDQEPDLLPVPLNLPQGIQGSKSDGVWKLYKAVSQLLGSQVPDVRFDSYADEVRKFEAEYRNERTSLRDRAGARPPSETVANPRVLCISSPQFLKLGYQDQLEVVLKAFPEDIEHVRVFNSADLQRQLNDGPFGIVHIAAFVCPRSGDMYFSDIDLNSGAGNTQERDVFGAKALATLLEMANTRLAVITSSDSLALAATLLSVTNVVATRDMLSPKVMAAWVAGFYDMLKKKSLAESFEYAVSMSRAPMCLYPRSGGGDIVFKVGRDRKTDISGDAVATGR